MIDIRIYVGSCNGYLTGDIMIDAPHGVQLPGMGSVVITHEHCDHFAGMKNSVRTRIASYFCAGIINNRKERLGLCHSLNMKFPKVTINKIVKDGEILEGDGLQLNVLETPGHATGAICLYDPDRKALFSGDTVFSDFSFPNCGLPTSEPERLIRSYEKLAALDVRIIFPGHGEEINEKGYIEKMLRIMKKRE